jgi:WD40 repeat protein
MIILQNSADGTVNKTLEIPKVVEWEGRYIRVDSIAFSPDGRTLVGGLVEGSPATMGVNGKIVLWDVATGIIVHTMDGHTNGVNFITFSPDGRILASASLDCTVKLWDTASGTYLQTLAGDYAQGCDQNNHIKYNVYVYSPTFSSDGHTLAFASSYGILVWSLDIN